MRRSSLSLTIAATSLLLLAAAPAHAQASRTWVSGVGDDANPCSRTAPCKTFAGAISKTMVNGEINCLDPGGFGAVTITKSITIDCHEVFASILFSGTNGVNIPFSSFAASDVRKTVRLRNINFNGVDTGIIGIRITGAVAGTTVIIEDCLIDGTFGGAATGISDERTAGGELYIANTTVRNAGANGILISPGGAAAPAAGQRINATLDNVLVLNASVAGIFVSNNGRVMINRSTISGHSQVGVAAAGALAAIQVNISNTTISDNGLGVGNLGGTITIRLSNNDISFNTTAIQGATQSHINNRLQGNESIGTAPTAIGATTNPTGLQ
jgi:hypothetical protein